MHYTQSLESAELAALESRWGPFPIQRHTLDVAHPFLSGDHQRLVSDGRRAEICYVMHRGDPADGVLLHIKSFYPEGAFRLPTGGIHQNESVEETLTREIYEETGLVVDQWACDQAAGRQSISDNGVCVERLLGVTGYLFRHPDLGECTFATYTFLTRMPAAARPVPTDPEENIADWAWTPAHALPTVADRLATVSDIAPAWADWGRFRAYAHHFAAQALL